MISLERKILYTDPYPVAVCDDIMPREDFDRLVETFPSTLDGSRRNASDRKYNKDCLSSRHHSEDFIAFMEGAPEWYAFYRYIKKQFPLLVEQALGLDVKTFGSRKVLFEFSSLPGDGGGLQPHPDSVKKVATAVMYCETEWDMEWGGGFEVLRHRRDPHGNFDGRRAEWDECDTSHIVTIRPNRMLFMERRPYSLHGVRPLHAPRPRRSVTINLVCKDAT